MNYRDFYKKEQTLAGSRRLAENVDLSKIPPDLLKGVEVELEHTPSKGKKLEDASPADLKKALETAIDHHKEDKNYYSKLTKAGLEECGAGESYGGWTPVQPQLGLDVPSRIRPVSIVNLVNPVAAFGGSAMGMNARPDSAVGSVAGDKEKITAAGETDPAIAQKSVGGSVVPNKGQEQGGPNTKGTIAGTPGNSSTKAECNGGPNTKGSVGGTPRNPALGLRGSDLIHGGMGVTTNQSRLGQFAEEEKEEEISLEQPETDDFEDANRREVDSMSAEKEDSGEEGEDVTIKLNESMKEIVREVVNEVVGEAKKKWRQKTTKPTAPERKTSVKRFKKSGDLHKEATFISRKINEGRELTMDERGVIREILISKALRLKESMDADMGWAEAGDQQSGILDSWIRDIVKYRSKTDTVEDLVSSIIGVAEDKLGIRHVDDADVERQVIELMAKIPAKY